MKILGINNFHADASAALLDNGNIITAIEEERLTRIKHYAGFPLSSINVCLDQANLKIEDLDCITINYNSYYNLNNKVLFGIKSLGDFKYLFDKFFFLKKKYSLKKSLYTFFGYNFEKKIYYVPHHLSHACSSFYFSGYDEAISLSFDASGDFSTIEAYLINKKKN